MNAEDNFDYIDLCVITRARRRRRLKLVRGEARRGTYLPRRDFSLRGFRETDDRIDGGALLRTQTGRLNLEPIEPAQQVSTCLIRMQLILLIVTRTPIVL